MFKISSVHRIPVSQSFFNRQKNCSEWAVLMISWSALHVSEDEGGGGMAVGGAVGGATGRMCGGSQWVLSRMMVWRGTMVMLPKKMASTVACTQGEMIVILNFSTIITCVLMPRVIL